MKPFKVKPHQSIDNHNVVFGEQCLEKPLLHSFSQDQEGILSLCQVSPISALLCALALLLAIVRNLGDMHESVQCMRSAAADKQYFLFQTFLIQVVMPVHLFDSMNSVNIFTLFLHSFICSTFTVYTLYKRLCTCPPT